MMDLLFFGSLVLYFLGTLAQMVAWAFKNAKAQKTAFLFLMGGMACLTGYLLWRGIVAGRLPLSNQFEFCTGFAWGVSLLCILFHYVSKQPLVARIGLPFLFLTLSYAALLPREVTQLMPALRSSWFALHIGSAVFSYAGFVIASMLGGRYLYLLKKGETLDSIHLRKLDFDSYRMISFGFLLLTVVILSGCIWAEQAWSRFWSWDPKETWALVTWIVYAVYLHLRMRKKMQGKVMAWLSIVALIFVLFTFVGVNHLLPGLHAY